ncbi:MAG: AAA family ATPase, partial [Nitrospiraceae bacterium]
MLVYASTKSSFLNDVRAGTIDDKILASFWRHLGRVTSKNEITSWRNSMMYMSQVLADEDIPDDSGVAIEYTLPQTTKRIDFILTGKGENKQGAAIIIELKQWESVKATPMDGVVRTFVGGAEREVSHPSYQAWTYAALLEDFNETVQKENIGLRPCAYLHNCVSNDVINDPFYEYHIRRAPAFLRKDTQKLAEFIKQYVKYGD